MDWNDETIAKLRALWAEGHSTAEIGRRMGVSKNAVVGKAHRLNLPARPSPIRREGQTGTAPRRPTARRVTGPTLPPLAATPVADTSETEVTLPAAAPVAVSPPPSPVRPVPAQAAALRAVAPARHRSVSCCWPIGEPGTKSFHFCDSEAMAGKPYCPDHAQLAYVKVRDRRDEAAA